MEITDMPHTLLIVDDDPPQWIRPLRTLAEDLGFTVVVAVSAESAMRILEKKPDIPIIISDVQMGRWSGVHLLQFIYRSYDDGLHPPTLLHSSEAQFTSSDFGHIDLKAHVDEYFGAFARFCLKSRHLTEEKEFLEEFLLAHPH
jgi:CheY-like chemotaxis protein